MTQPRIVVEFHPNGTVQVKPEGFPGGQCRDATRFLEEALGQVVESTDTAEAFMTEIVDSQNIRGS
ncbi:MAG: DUF2997 domain-containing protein [Myxococcota bacterium]